MSKRCLIQYAVGKDYNDQLSLTMLRNADYCRRNNATFLVSVNKIENGKRAGWDKIDHIIKATYQGYDDIIYMDTDCIIKDLSFDLWSLCEPDLVGFTEHYTSPNTDNKEKHYNTGVMAIGKGCKDFFVRWSLQDENNHAWMEQHPLQEMMKLSFYKERSKLMDNKFNMMPSICPSDECVVRAFHGMPDRFRIMQDYLKTI